MDSRDLFLSNPHSKVEGNSFLNLKLRGIKNVIIIIPSEIKSISMNIYKITLFKITI